MKLGELLVRDRRIAEDQLAEAMATQARDGGRLGSVLIEMGLLDAELLTVYLGLELGLPIASGPTLERCKRSAVILLTPDQAARFRAVPIVIQGQTLLVAMHDPHDLQALDAIANTTGYRVIPRVAPEIRVYYYLERYYGVPRPDRFHKLGDAPRGDATPRRRDDLPAPPLPGLPPQHEQPPPPVAQLVDIKRLEHSVPPPPPLLTGDGPQGRRLASEAADLTSALDECEDLPAVDLDVENLVEEETQAAKPVDNASTDAACADDVPADDLHADEPRGDEANGGQPSGDAVYAADADAGELHADDADAGELHADDADAGEVHADEADAGPADDGPVDEGWGSGEDVAEPQRPAVTFADTLDAISTAANRADIADAVLRYCETIFDTAVLFLVRDQIAFGWKSAGTTHDSERVESLLVPLEVPSMFQMALHNNRLFRGTASPSAIHSHLAKILHSPDAAACTVGIIEINGRPVNVLYGERHGIGNVSEDDVAAIRKLMKAVESSYVRLISQKKRKDKQSNPPAPTAN